MNYIKSYLKHYLGIIITIIVLALLYAFIIPLAISSYPLIGILIVFATILLVLYIPYKLIKSIEKKSKK